MFQSTEACQISRICSIARQPYGSWSSALSATSPSPCTWPRAMPNSLAENDHPSIEAEHLLPKDEDEDSMEMADVSPESSRTKNTSHVETTYTDEPDLVGSSRLAPVETVQSSSPIMGRQQTTFKVYKMRWFGLGQLVLLNIVVSWDVGGAEL